MPITFTSEEKQLLADGIPLLIARHKENRRAYPWREPEEGRDTPSAYHVWLSEIMLQQTRIEAALPYYTRFLEALPDIGSLAVCEDDALMKLWQGLGYYSRARNLKKAAVTVTEQYGGEMPADADALRALPGIGDYTAGAIASIAFGLPEPAVDGNVLRVLMRFFSREDDVMKTPTREGVTNLLRTLYPSGRDAGYLTEGLMELGETVCLPNTAPMCDNCPIKDLCRGAAEGTAASLPVRTRPAPRRVEDKTVFLIRCGGKVLVRKRGEGLLAGMYEFPNVEGHLSAADTAELFGTDEGNVTTLEKAKHVFSHVEWHMIAYLVTLPGIPSAFPDAAALSPQEILSDCAVPNAFRKYREMLETM